MRILLCDDHAVVRDGLRLVLEALGPEVVLLDADGIAAALEVTGGDPDLDLILLDLHLPDAKGLDGLQRLRDAYPTVPVAVVSAEEDARTMREVLDLGASGYIPKSAGREELLAAVRLILSGGVFVPQAALQTPAEDRAQAESARRQERAARLTGRQLEVLSLMARGLTNREICRVLGIAENTVKTHVKAILEALDATNRTEAAVLARELDLRAPGEA